MVYLSSEGVHLNNIKVVEMKKIKRVLLEAQSFPLWKAMMQAFVIMAVGNAILLLGMYAKTGAIPSVSTVSFGWWWHWELPFSVSRLFDVLVGPFCMVLLTWACRYDCFYASLSDIEGYSSGCDFPSSHPSIFGLFFSVALVGGMLYSMVFGALSFPVGLVVFSALFVIMCVVYVVVLVVRYWGT